MTTPIDILATALWGTATDAHRLAEAAANALTDDRIIANAAEALVATGWTSTSRRESARAMAEIVLRSVGGAA